MSFKKGKAYLLGGNKPWSIEHIDKVNEKVIDKLYQNYSQLEMREKAENTGKTMGKHIVKLYTNGVNKFLKIDDPIALRRDIKEDPIIKDSYGRHWCFNDINLWKMVSTLINYLVILQIIPSGLLKE